MPAVQAREEVRNASHSLEIRHDYTRESHPTRGQLEIGMDLPHQDVFALIPLRKVLGYVIVYTNHSKYSGQLGLIEPVSRSI